MTSYDDLRLRSFQGVEKWCANILKARFELLSAVAVGASPRFGAVLVAAVFAIVGIFDAEQVKVFLPIRSFLLEWGGAKTGFDPVSGSVIREPRILHVVNILITGDGASAERAVVDRAEQVLLFAGFQACLHEISHNFNMP